MAAVKTLLAIAAGDISGLGGAATLNVGTVAGTVAAGNDSRLLNAVDATLALIAAGGGAAQTLATQNLGGLTPGQLLAQAMTN